MNSFRSLLWVLAGAIMGAWGYVGLADYLDRAYRPFSTDVPAWIIIALPTGALLGGMSAYVVAAHFRGSYLSPGLACIVVSMVLNFFYVVTFLHTGSIYGAVYAASESGPALLWSSCLLGYGLVLVFMGVAGRQREK